MSGGEFAEIEARANAADDSRGAIQRADIYRIEVPSSFLDRISASQRDVRDLLAAVRERDNTIARVRALMESAPHLQDPWADDWKGEQVVPVDRLRAALDPQETP